MKPHGMCKPSTLRVPSAVKAIRLNNNTNATYLIGTKLIRNSGLVSSRNYSVLSMHGKATIQKRLFHSSQMPPEPTPIDQTALDEINVMTDHTSTEKKRPRKVKIDEFLLHGIEYDEKVDPTGLLMGEKYDGIRVLWNGKELISRAGKPLKAPHFFTEGLPKTFLDGELWVGRNKFESLISITRTKKEDPWVDLTYIVFDTPQVQQPFEARLDSIKKLSLPKHVKVAEYIKCTGRSHMKQYLQSILDGGGEGIVLRKPGSLYVSGRCSELLKLKPYQESEVRFKSLHQNSGGLLCDQPNGLECIVKCPHQIYQHPPKEGTIITVQHEGMWKTGKIRYPYFWRERFDLNWDDLVRDTPPAPGHTTEEKAE